MSDLKSPNQSELVQLLVQAAQAQQMPQAAYVLPDWPEGDPRWGVMEVNPGWWMDHYIDLIAERAKREVRTPRAGKIQEMIDGDEITREQAADGIGISVDELDSWLGT